MSNKSIEAKVDAVRSNAALICYSVISLLPSFDPPSIAIGIRTVVRVYELDRQTAKIQDKLTTSNLVQSSLFLFLLLGLWWCWRIRARHCLCRRTVDLDCSVMRYGSYLFPT